ncbi:hypothetical protein F8M41_013565 [Gigaspora margarita]|uniref:Uncharacterized protein n=1 Tax=Gigaspora margarita TaxID=4874 RepID=A0A8H3WYJ1_GIGMA|nr:hypothetical protein F8M41_013565 [Gigaspora margarita]
MIKSVDETSNDKDNLEMITTWVDNDNKIVYGEVATVINDEEMRSQIDMRMIGNSSTEWNDLSNCFESGSGSVMSVGNDNVKGDDNNVSICDHNEGNVNRIIDDEQHQNNKTMV